MVKKSSSSRKLNVYSNLSRSRKHVRKSKKESDVRRHAQYLASLPKHPIKRMFYRMHPKRFWGYWFSKRGGLMALKIAGVGLLLLTLMVGGLFAYFRKDLDSIRPEEIAKKVQSTVNTYLDRNGKLLWEDKGDGNYKSVVDSADLNDYIKNATIAIEDKDFYKHGGVSITGLIRAAINNIGSDTVQGGSTLTQQLVKQVFFTDTGEAADRGFGGIPRKIKELILSIEVERMYDKDQILTLYLNESPYGGRRNGAESGAQTYFGVSAKDLTLAQAALLAAIPQNPSKYDPYNVYGHEALIARQHTVLDNMADQGMVTKQEADDAKNVPILDNLRPAQDQYTDIRAPHFVQMVRSELEESLGKSIVGQGGLTITTTLDLDIQTKLEEAMNTMFSSSKPITAGFSNGAATVEDTQSGQIVAMMGSRDFTYPGFGQDNAAISYLQPGSTIKSLVYAQLFEKKPAGEANYGSGTILKDESIDSIYGAKLQNADHKFLGDISIRTGLATSRNIPAVKAMYISGVKPTLDEIHNMGAPSYCTQGSEVQVGLAAAIGGCGIKQVELINAYASLARQGIYKPIASVLKVVNNTGDTLQEWTDTEGTRAIDAQSAYIVSDILNDEIARRPLDGAHAIGMDIPGVRTASKTGTSDKNGFAKDIWMMSYSPALTMGVWLGNSDSTILKQGNSLIPGPIIATVMQYAHNDIYANQGKWKTGDWFTRPDGIQQVGNELYPSWWNKSQGQSNAKLTFDQVSRFKATICTPEAAKIELDVVKSVDPVTKKDVYSSVPAGYDATQDDSVHHCNADGSTTDSLPTASVLSANEVMPSTVPAKYNITVSVSQGTFTLFNLSIKVGGTVVTTIQSPTIGNNTYTYTAPGGTTTLQAVTATVNDTGYYSADSGDSGVKVPG